MREGEALRSAAPGAPAGSRSRGGVATRVSIVLLALLILAGCSAADPYAGLDAEGSYRAGLAAFEAEEWADAIQAFGLHIRQAPGHSLNPEARFYTARAYAERAEHITAIAEFEFFLGFHPSHGFAPEASLGICRSYAALSPIPPRDQRYTRDAMDACFATVQEFRGLNVAAEAESIARRMLEKLGQSDFEEGAFYQQRGCHPCALLIFEDVVQQYQDTPWSARAILAMVRSYEALGWSEEAEEEAQRLFANFPDSDAAAELRRDRGDEAPTAGG